MRKLKLQSREIVCPSRHRVLVVEPALEHKVSDSTAFSSHVISSSSLKVIDLKCKIPVDYKKNMYPSWEIYLNPIKLTEKFMSNTWIICFLLKH